MGGRSRKCGEKGGGGAKGGGRETGGGGGAKGGADAACGGGGGGGDDGDGDGGVWLSGMAVGYSESGVAVGGWGGGPGRMPNSPWYRMYMTEEAMGGGDSGGCIVLGAMGDAEAVGCWTTRLDLGEHTWWCSCRSSRNKIEPKEESE